MLPNVIVASWLIRCYEMRSNNFKVPVIDTFEVLVEATIKGYGSEKSKVGELQ